MKKSKIVDQTLVLPDGIKVVQKDHVPQKCGFRRVRFPASVEEVCFDVFRKCEELEEVDLSYTCCTEISTRAFSECPSLKRVRLPNAIKRIYHGSFADCPALTDINIPTSLEFIGFGAFRGCHGLKRLVLEGRRCIHIESMAFSECSGLEYVEIGEEILTKRFRRRGKMLGNEYESEIFSKCGALKEVVVRPCVRCLPPGCFKGCTALIKLMLPSSITIITPDTFTAVPGCGRRVQTKKNNGRLIVTNITGAVGDLEIQKGVVEVAKQACIGRRLTSIKIPPTVKKIGPHAFEGYRGEPVTVPPSVKMICKCAFGQYEDVLVPSRCRVGYDIRKFPRYVEQDYPLIISVIDRCNQLLNEPKVDMKKLLDELAPAKKIRFVGEKTDWRQLMASRIKGIERVLNLDTLFSLPVDRRVKFMEFCIAYGLIRPDADKRSSGVYVYDFARKLYHDARIKLLENHDLRLALIRRLVSRNMDIVKYRKGRVSCANREWPLLYDIAFGGEGKDVPAVAKDCEEIISACGFGCATEGIMSNFDEGIMEALREDSIAMLIMRLDLLGQLPDAVLIDYLMGHQRARLLSALLGHYPEIATKLPVRSLLLHACMHWRSESILALLDGVCGRFGEECRRARDMHGCDALWCTLYNPNLKGKGNPVERKLLELGYMADTANDFGFVYEEIVTDTVKTASAMEEFQDMLRNAGNVPKKGAVAVKVVARKSGRESNPIQRKLTERPSGYIDATAFLNGVKEVEPWSHAEDGGITKLWIPADVNTVGSFAFKGCQNLEEVVFDESWGPELSVGVMAFAGCPKLRKVCLPGRVAHIGAGAFRDCPKLSEFKVGVRSKPTIVEGHVFDNCPEQEAKYEDLMWGSCRA